jgi:phenylpropionate dioxygenase-like ring-hydroxylating dioxygenase large terminal subunit
LGNPVPQPAAAAVDATWGCGVRDLGVDRIPVSQYISEDFYEREKSAIWRQSWLLVGRASDIGKPGDYFLFDLDVVSASILIVRGKDGAIRAFYNACKHRGAKVRYAEKGSCRALTCTFHGWVYDLEGRLVAVPFKDQFPDCGWESLRLKSVNVDTWGGFVFVNLDHEPRCTLREYLQPLPDALGDYFANEDWQFYFGYKGIFNANWKILVDVQTEGHHGPFLHRRTVSGAFKPEHFPVVPFPQSIGVPYRLSVFHPDYEAPGNIAPSPVTQLAFKHGTASLYTQKGCGSVVEKYPGAVNPAGREHWIFDDYTLFPNTVFLIMDRQLIVQRCWPLTTHTTAWEISHYFADPVRSFGDRFSRDHGVIGEWNTITEDMVTVEGIHQSYRSGAVDGMYLSDLEVGVRAYQRLIKQAVGTAA